MPPSPRRRHALRLLPITLISAAILAFAGAGAGAAQAATPALNVSGISPLVLQPALATGAKYIRIFVDWQVLEPDQAGQYPGYKNAPNLGAANLANQYELAVKQINAAGAKPIFVVLGAPGWANGSSADHLVPPTDPEKFASFFARFVQRTGSVGQVAAYEVWNEQDALEFWHGKEDPNAPGNLDRSEWKRYAELLKASYKAADPYAGNAAIIMGATTGNNFDFVSAMYEQGLKGSFDGVAVHTDTACLRFGPDFYVRNGAGGPINQYSFLGYRSVRAVMLANDDAKPQIWMTEVGWSSTNGGPTSCARGSSAGKAPSGVSEAQQAALLTQAFGCMARDPYVAVAAWFTFSDQTMYKLDELNHYGLVNTGLGAKPALAAFKAVVASNGGAPGPCGDFSPPSVRIVSPTPGVGFTTALLVTATATDAADEGVAPAGLTQISYRLEGGEPFYRFNDVKDGDTVTLNWLRAANLADGTHILTVDAKDALGNVASTSVPICKGAKCVMTAVPTKIALPSGRNPSCKKRSCSFKGRLTAPADKALSGRVRVEWQHYAKMRVKSTVPGRKRYVSKWVTFHKGGSAATKPFAFKQKLKRAGKWRVRAYYDGASPLAGTTTKFLAFSVK
ncbi:hypothetical protein DSM112329_01529 [Paraconexibacter sp. AEG42_29]|uniref:Cellulase family glycosylhydrolase n=1 Tax=Paraconexibacter sp. AEG42_29 TaxID=2997339 RepID=A0AAU7ASR1_9ACTN